MKTLLLILLTIFAKGQCMEDIARYATYSYMEVFNHDTQEYEKYRKVHEVQIMVIVDPQNKTISFTDSINQYFKEYEILDCQMGKTELVYKCKDISKKRNCEFIFSMDKSLTVVYEERPIIYRVKNQ